MHILKCTHVSPRAMHCSHPCEPRPTSRIWSVRLHCRLVPSSFWAANLMFDSTPIFSPLPSGSRLRSPCHLPFEGVAEAVLRERPENGHAGDAIGVRAVNDDLVVRIEGLQYLLDGVEVQRTRDVLGAVGPIT